jgi:hypothetical protein
VVGVINIELPFLSKKERPMWGVLPSIRPSVRPFFYISFPPANYNRGVNRLSDFYEILYRIPLLPRAEKQA